MTTITLNENAKLNGLCFNEPVELLFNGNNCSVTNSEFRGGWNVRFTKPEYENPSNALEGNSVLFK